MNIGYAVKSGGDVKVYGALGVDNPRYDTWKAEYEAEGCVIVEAEHSGGDPWGIPGALKYVDPAVLQKTDEERYRTPLVETATNIANYLREQEYEADIDYELVSGNTGKFRCSGPSKFDILGSLSTASMFPTTWKCEEGDEIVTLPDMQGLVVAIAERRQTSVYFYRDLKDSFDTLPLDDLRDWITANQP